MSGARKVAVLGAGTVGVCVALYLQRDGHDVQLIDRDMPGAGCSYGSAGLIQCCSVVPVATPGIVKSVPRMLLDPDQPLVVRWRHLPSLAPYLLRFMREACPARAEANSHALASIVMPAYESYRPLVAAAGIQGMVRKSGEFHVYETESAFRRAQPTYDMRRARGVRVEMLDAAQTREREPALSPACKRGVFMPDAYQTVNPFEFTAALARHFVANGGRFIKESIDDVVPEEGRVRVITAGRVMEADDVVLALGAFSKAWAGKFGDNVNLNSERGYHVMIPQPGVRLNGTVLSGEHRFAMSPIDDGIRLAGTAELAKVGAPANFARANRLAPLAKRLLPGLGDQGQTIWMGHRPSTPDSLPVLGRASRHRNVFYAFGHNHSGLTLAGITGMLLAELIGGRPSSVDLTPFRASRFS